MFKKIVGLLFILSLAVVPTACETGDEEILEIPVEEMTDDEDEVREDIDDRGKS